MFRSRSARRKNKILFARINFGLYRLSDEKDLYDIYHVKCDRSSLNGTIFAGFLSVKLLQLSSAQILNARSNVMKIEIAITASRGLLMLSYFVY